MKVAIVGGGLAGVSAAIKLAKVPNVRVILFEAKNRLGGRAGSFLSKSNDGTAEEVDYCQHVGMGCCQNLKQLIADLGQETDWETHAKLHFYGPNGNHQILSSLPLLPAPLHLATWLLKWPGLKLKDRISVAQGMLKIRKLKNNDLLDEQPALDWLKEAGQTDLALDQFWTTIIVSALGEHLRNVSMASVCKVLQDGFLNTRDAYHLLVPKQPLCTLFNNGSQQTLTKLNVDIRLNSQVKYFESASNGVSIESATGKEQFDKVILAVPWFALNKLSIDPSFRTLEEQITLPMSLESSPITGIHTWWNNAWLQTPHAVIVGRFCQWVFPKPNSPTHGESNAGEHYYQIVVSASHSLKNIPREDLNRLVHDDLAHVFRNAGTSKLLRTKVVTDPNAVFSVAPGALKMRPRVDLIDDRFVLAGDWTKTGWPATMEGAIISGKEAASVLLANGKRPKHP